MKDAFGGIFNLAIIAVFFVVVMGILGLTVNYTKAFRAKNIIISTLEEYGGTGATCFNKDRACFEKIKDRLESISYHPHSINCPTNGTDGHLNWYQAPRDANSKDEVLFCYAGEVALSDNYIKKYEKNPTGCSKNPYVFTVVTQVDIDIPIINKIMGLYFFQVKGDTRVIEYRNMDSNNLKCDN